MSRVFCEWHLERKRTSAPHNPADQSMAVRIAGTASGWMGAPHASTSAVFPSPSIRCAPSIHRCIAVIPHMGAVMHFQGYPPSPPHVQYYDFAHELGGSLRMPAENIRHVSAKTFAELLSGPMLDVYVGEKRRHWALHRNLLCHHAQYFDETMPADGKSNRIQDGKIEFPDEDETAFEILVKWLYQGKIESVSTLPSDKKWDYAYTCQKLYLLCDKIGMQELKNNAIDQFRKGCYETRLVPGPEEMKPIYEKTPPSSPFRKLVSRIAARQIMDPNGKKDATTYKTCFEATPEFAIDVINAIKDSAGGSLFDDPTEGNSCRYHEHANGESCHKTVKFKIDKEVT